MLKKVFTIRDNVAQISHKPFTDINHASAIRAFCNTAKENPDRNDYSLYYIGEFNEDNGELTAETPTRIFDGLSIKDEVQIDEK